MSDKFTRLKPGQKLRAPAARDASAPGAAIARLTDRDEMQLSYQQQQQWLLYQLAPDSPAYHVPLVLHLRGALDADALRRAFQEIVVRHESLRTVFRARDGVPYQKIEPATRWELPCADLSGLPSDARQRELAKLMAAEASRRFDLATGPVMRTCLYRLEATEHVLQVTVHHIAVDDWSLDVLWRELGAIYAAHLQGAPATLPPLSIQYGDYAAWQRSSLVNEAHAGLIEYWKERLAGAPDDTALPFKGPRPPAQTFAGRSRSVELPRELAVRVGQLARSEGATVFMTLLAAFRALLYRYTGQLDICIGTPIASRGRSEVQGLIGYFVNTLVLRTPVTPSQSFAELMAEEKQTSLGAYDHQDLPFEHLVDALQLPRASNRSVLFQVMLSHEAGAKTYAMPGLEVAPMRPPIEPATFDLHVATWERGEAMGAVFNYNVDLFTDEMVEQMARHFVRLLDQVTADPRQSIARISLLGDAERRAVLARWCAPERESGLDRLVHQLIEDQVDRHPDAIAVTGIGAQLTYRELDRRANQLARRLSARGAGPDRLVAILVERSPDMVVALLAVLKAGAAFLPLDVTHPRDRIQTIMAASGVELLVGHAKWAGLVHEGSTRAIWLDRDASAIAAEPQSRVLVPVAGENLAYVLFTSGSTGRPKGVMIEHRGLANYLAYCREAYPVESGPGAPVHSAITFDLTITSVIAPLLGGRSVHLVPEGAGVENLVAALLSAGPMSFLKVTPTHLDLLASTIAPEQAARLASCFIIGGEQLLERQLAFWREHAPVVVIVNEYGPTETVVGCCVHRETSSGSGPGAVAIGHPFAGNRLYVLDEALAPVPPGVPGELYIGGAQVARGYLGRPDLTAERFVPDPNGSGDRLYRTGDLVRARPDGALEFLGRLDHQVKIRGFRIELGEIENVLASHPSVSGCVVVVKRDPDGNDQLVAYVAPDKVDVPAVRTHLASRLPEYMVPSIVMTLPALPLTPSGKIDRKALPEVSAEALAHQAFVPPASETEIALAAMWCEVLKIGQVGVHDNFFTLGGHSLLVVRLIVRIKAKLGVTLTPRAVFDAPTLGALAKRIDALAHDAKRTTRSESPIVRIADRRELALSFAQQRQWFLHQFAPQSYAYHVQLLLRLHGSLDVELLRDAFEKVIERHEILRTVYPARDGVPYQQILPPSHWDLPVDDLTLVAGTQRDLELKQRMATEGLRPFDLERSVVRARLYRLGPNEHVLQMTVHHIASDEWSLEVLWRETSALYEASRRGKPAPLGALPIQYADFAAWQRTALSTEEHARQLAYWKQRLTGAPEDTALPFKGSRPAIQTFVGASSTIELPSAVAARLRELAQREGATLFMTLLAAVRTLLFRYTQQEDLCIGTPIANRGRAEIQGLIGLFVNTLVLRTPVTPSVGFAELLAREKRMALDAYEHQDLPFEQLVDAMHLPRSPNRTPLFQVMFRHEQLQLVSGIEGITVEPFESPIEPASFDLDVATWERGETIGVTFYYNVELFDAPQIQRMLGHFQTLLENVTREPGRSIGELSILTEGERQQLVVDWNATQADFPRTSCVHHLVEAQVARTPDAIAVVLGDKQLTYRELDTRAEHLAAVLQSRGVGPDVLVGISAERSLDMMVALFAILKAGGAYVALDPAYPVERLVGIVKDAQPAVVLVDKIGERVLGRDACAPVPILSFDTARELEAPARASAAHTSNQLAYVIYTSGSTGRPKGVQIEHRSLVNHITWQIGAFGFSSRDTLLQRTSISFDASVWELWTLLTIGGRVVLLAPGDERSPGDIARTIDKQGVTIAQFVPSLLKLLTEQTEHPFRCDFIFSGGERLEPSLAATARARSRRGLVNLYGPTEATIDATSWVCPEQVPPVIPIGRPIANTRAYVLDRQMQPVPLGVLGELYLGGAGVARGYLRRQDLTAERFVHDPFGDGALYRTGDVCRWSEAGTLEFMGRLDHQVKLRGYRIELGEIESALASHPAVRASVVVVARDANGDDRLVAYVAPAEVDIADLRAHLASQLPDYMVPSLVMRLASMPLTPNGKIDRKALPAPEHAVATAAYVAPSGEVEEALARIWCEVIGVDRVGARDDFFALGGHSLTAIRVTALLRRELGIEVPVRLMFENPVLADLARAVAARRGAAAPTETFATVLEEVLDKGSTATVVRATVCQEYFWSLEQAAPDPTAYATQGCTVIEGPLDRTRFARAVEATINGNTVYRTEHFLRDGTLYQRIATGVPPFELQIVDFGELARDAWDARIEEAIADLVAGIEMVPGREIAARLLCFGPAHHAFATSVHHGIIDGGGYGVLWKEIWLRYEGRAPAETVQFFSYSEALERFGRTRLGQARREAWISYLRGAPAVEIPIEGGRAEVDARREQIRRGITADRMHFPYFSKPVPAPSREMAVQLGESQRASAYVVYLSALAWLLHRHSGQRDICVQTAYNPRAEHARLSDLHGPAVTWKIVRIDLEGCRDLRDVVPRALRSFLESNELGVFPDFFELVPHSLRRLVFNYIPATGGTPVQTPGLTFVPVNRPFPKWLRPWDLHLTMIDGASQASAFWTGNDALFGRDAVEALLHEYFEILARGR